MDRSISPVAFRILVFAALFVAPGSTSSRIHDVIKGRLDEVGAEALTSVEDVWGRAKEVGRETLGAVVEEIKEIVDPWTVNKNVCPPILCGPTMDSAIQGEPSAFAAAMEPSAAFPFFEGDIVLDSKQKSQMTKKKRKRSRVTRNRKTARRRKRAIVKPRDKHWKYAHVPYKIDQGFDDDVKELIHRAHRHIERQTCVRFMPKANDDRDYLFYINQPGCWSYVGKSGGKQPVSLGFGCDQLGTAVHETCHALGFWHEQSRSDRNNYVEILDDNVARAGKAQFGKRDKNEIYSMGYAYDYESIMHYGAKYFSNSGRDTIKVKGIGETLGLKIGQRRGLSGIDVAQLNDMYYCNSKHQTERVCGKGWEPFDGSCFKFVSNENQTYNGARSGCLGLGARLAHVTSGGMFKFVKTVMKDKFPALATWRVGAKKIDGELKWEDPAGRRHRPIKYEAWAKGHPGKYSTVVLSDVGGDGVVWKGTWAGSAAQPDKFAYPYICERKDYVCEKGWINWGDSCYHFADNSNYTFDRAHEKCLSRSAQLLHINDEFEDTFIKHHLISEYPKTRKWRTGARKRGSKFYWYGKDDKYRKMKYKNWSPNHPGKYTNMALTFYNGSPKRFVWRGAHPGESTRASGNLFPFICEKEATVNCFKSRTKDGRDYRGEVTYSEHGVTCQSWTSQYPHQHDYMTGQPGRDQQEGLGDHNYCRNPYGRRARPWCYVPLKNTVWQYCDISVC